MINVQYNNQVLSPYVVIVNAINTIYFYTAQLLAMSDFLGIKVVIDEEMPEGFNNPDWRLYKGNPNHVKNYHKCVELFWLIWQGQQITGYAFFQQPWIAKTLGVSIRQVQNVIAELKKCGLIEVVRKDQNYYRVTEFFSRPPQDWTIVAIEKGKKAVADFFASTKREQKQQSKDEQEKASRSKRGRPRKEKVYTKAKAKANSPSVQTTQEEKEQAEALSKKIREDYETSLLVEQTYKQEEKQPVSKELMALVEEVAEEVAREHGKFPEREIYIQEIKTKLEKKAIKSPDWLITRTAIRWPEKRQYYLSNIWR